MDNKQEKNIHLLYKELGETPNQCLTRFKLKNPDYSNVPVTYAGRLDPVAEGLLLALSGDETREKDKFLDLPKTYEFEMLWGFSTDTLDVLGLASSKEVKIPTTIEVREFLSKIAGKFEQEYPAFSSKPVLGKPLFLWAKEGKLSEVTIPGHEVEIFEADHISRRSMMGNDLLNDINSRIKLVVGDFRQKEILEGWKKVFENKSDEIFTIDKISMSVSGGFYIRQFVSDFAKKSDSTAVAFHIKRTQVGDFMVDDCIG